MESWTQSCNITAIHGKSIVFYSNYIWAYLHHISRQQAFFNVRKLNVQLCTFQSIPKINNFRQSATVYWYIDNTSVNFLNSPCEVFSHVYVCAFPVSTALISIRIISVPWRSFKIWFINCPRYRGIKRKLYSEIFKKQINLNRRLLGVTRLV